MKALKISAILSVLAFGLMTTSAFAEVPELPSNISSNDHVAAAAYYESLAMEEAVIVEKYRQDLEEHEDHAYAYGRRGQDEVSHLRANIREHEYQRAEDLAQAELHRKLSTVEQQAQNTSSSSMNAAAIQ
ncbi:MAG: hypothetical protein K2Y09_03530 [Nitrosomonas sp.]|uniref:hypothetical protein n=1 Tax=Nitrosomonas sp. TaxID=42353 RepID=UPI001DF1DD4D|nr:hypothetical protein [Nitrosomonas sp.]MBX9894236.1 hypothetical protein [Nitrosomonas sp.]